MTEGHSAEAAERPRGQWWRTVLYGVILLAVTAGVIHPLRRYVVEPRRQELLGRTEPPARQLALASQFAFDTVAGYSVRIVPGSPTLELGDLPTEAVTLVLGGFRGPYVAWLRVKAEEEKEEKIHFDLVDRYTKIAMLQRDYPAVWTDLGWNMAYNLSVQWQSPERKYQWIRRGIEFLMEGSRWNPHSSEILLDIGSFYMNKVGLSQEGAYYRRRVREDEGRSTFLVAYEWLDRARKVREQYGSSGYGLSRPVASSSACHALSYYATELTQDAYDAFQAGMDARRAGREADARKSFAEGVDALREAVGAWQWARREWLEQAVRFEKEDIPLSLVERYKQFYEEANQMATKLAADLAKLTYENLPEVFAKMTRPPLQ